MNQPLAYVHPGAKIAKNVVIEPFTTINNNVVIGEGTWIGSNVTIMEGARIGKNCNIFPGSVISANPQDLKYNDEDTTVVIGDNVTIRECVTINRGTTDRMKTVVGDNCLLMAYSHVAHDCIIGDHAILANSANLAGHVEVGKNVVIGGIMQHIEQAGVHSGDSACSLPAYSLSQEICDVMRKQVADMAIELGVVGLMNTQFAVKDNEVYLIEVNPRAARTVPFVSKATGLPLAKVAARAMVGQSLESQGVREEIIPPFYSVKEVVIPFNKFHGVVILAENCI